MTLLPLMLAAVLSAGNAEFDAAAKYCAFDVCCQRELVRLKSEGPAKGVLAAKMLADPSGYDTVENARRTAEEDYVSALTSEYRDSAVKAAAELGIACCIDGCFPYGSDADDRRVFERRFAEERAAACAEQAKSIAAEVKPAEADFGRKDEAVIRAELTASVISQQRMTVFEENRRYVSETIVGPVMESAKKEFERQRAFLRRTRCEAYAPSVLARELAENLAKNVRERNAKRLSEPIVWDVFPAVVENGAAEVAEKRTLERFVRAIDDTEVHVDAGFVRGRIAADFARHRKSVDSERAFGEDFTALVTETAMNRIAAEAPEAEREEFRGFVKERTGAETVVKAVDSRVRSELLPKVRELRREIAAEDSRCFWPALMDGTWYPEPSLADDVCARSDYASAVKRWRDSPELVSFVRAADGAVLIEETERMADARVAKAFDLARSAINAQNAVLDKVWPSVLGAEKVRSSGWFARRPDVKRIAGLLTAAVEAEWSGMREEVLWGGENKPSNAAEQHRELFPSVRNRIELLAKTILKELDEPERRPDPEVPSPQQDESDEVEFSVSVKRSGERLETRILRGGEKVFERSCPADAVEFRSVSGALVDKLVEVLELK